MSSRITPQLRLSTSMLTVAIVSLWLTPAAYADLHDKKTTITFNAPVEIPGKALPAGTYVFRLLDSTADRTIVQIFDKDEKRLIATVLAVPNYRSKPGDKPMVMFEERPPGVPEAIKAWGYPGDDYALQFVYPHDKATELAKQTHQNVLSMSNDMTQNMAAQSKSASDDSVQQLEKTQVTAMQPSGDEADLLIIITAKPDR